jgi:hypothetical protein
MKTSDTDGDFLNKTCRRAKKHDNPFNVRLNIMYLIYNKSFSTEHYLQ